MEKHQLTERKGHYSGNRRLDVSECEEPIKDDAEEREKWLEGGRKVRIKRKLRRWKNNISGTIDPKQLTIHLVGQSHIDIAWMWREEQTRKKAQVTFRKAILHSEVFPKQFHFALSQPILLEWIKEDNPSLFEKIQEKVNTGNIELVGGSYVEPDCMMPSAEAMIRQRLYGMRFYKEHFNILPSIEWFLDSFGYNYGLAQILVKSGVKYFWTTKLTWNQDTNFPFVNFWWKSPDGTKLLTCNFHYDAQVIETWEDYEIGRHLLTENGKKIWNYKDDYSKLGKYVKKGDICPHVGFFFGQSDGGHGPTHKEVAEANKLASLSWFKWSTVEGFFKEVETFDEHIPIWDDELYLEFHRGCFSNHSRVKRYNRKFENLLTSLESLLVLLDHLLSEYEYPRDDMEFLWKTTLKNQFHDILPGSSIPEVYDDCWEDWVQQEEVIEHLKVQIGKNLSRTKNEELKSFSTYIFLYNSLSWKRRCRVFIPITIFQERLSVQSSKKPKYAKLTILNGEQKKYICQPVEPDPEDSIDLRPAGWWTVLKLDPLSISAARIELVDDLEDSLIKNAEKIAVSKEQISNNHVNITIDGKNGAIIGLRSENINKGKNMIKGSESNLIFGFLDRVPSQYHAWNLTPEYWDHPLEYSHENNLQITVEECGPIFSRIKIEKMLGESPIRQTITLFKDCPEIFINFYTDWRQKDAMLKIAYTPNIDSEEVTADGMTCAITSKVHPVNPCDKARFEKICHKYFDISTPQNEWGIAILNEGKYAFDTLSGKMRLTLLRACRYPESAPEAWVNLERDLNKERFGHIAPEYSGIGPMSCRYALLPHKGGSLQNADRSPNIFVTRKAEEFNNPVLLIPTIKGINLEALGPFQEPALTISPDNVRLSALKKNEWDRDNTIILRVYEFCGKASDVMINFSTTLTSTISKVFLVDLLEREIEGEFTYHYNGRLSFPIKKFELRTFKLVFT